MKYPFIVCLCVGAVLPVTLSANTFDEAWKNGSLKGKLGVYYENIDRDNAVLDDSFSNLFFSLKYETAEWNRFQLGTELFAAHKLTDENNQYFNDFEGTDDTQAAVSEFYIRYNFLEKSHLNVGRFNHKKISHLDDAQSQGAYIQVNEIDNLSINAGVTTEYAELDYDDYEDFGRRNGSQDLSTNTATDDYLLFIDANYKLSDSVELSPYLYHQGDFATIIGADLALSFKLDDAKVGADIGLYSVDANATNAGLDSTVYAILPWIKFNKFKLGVGYASFEQGVSKPFWFADYLTGFDQENYYASTGADDLTAVQATIEYKDGPFKIRYGAQQWETDNNALVDELEQEIIVGYKFTKQADISLRYFDIDDNNANDYNKLETRVRYKF